MWFSEIFLSEPNTISDIKRLSNENRLEDALITYTSTLKRKIAQRFHDNISYYNKGKYLIVHCSDMKLCECTVAVLKDKGIRIQ